ncbi:hypothetical protein ACJ73_09121 [Blastomyces percursus]|uniref:Glutamine amidotransferase type-2 domain-containing protein n=1 Tax=Blastomyces percursus TaxID=1658174 RepID=A0A1J9PC16_9EURO|nr:hypothetical protein ACJ73_09121 [Blastomyces percursus]
MCGTTASIALPLGHVRRGTHGSPEAASDESLTYKLQSSLKKIKHGRLDGSGVWVSPDGSVGLGHCRLAINDLFPSGSQPLSSDYGQIHAVVNGEIYDDAAGASVLSSTATNFMAKAIASSCIAERTAKWLGVTTIKKVVNEATLADNFTDAAYHCEHDNNNLNFVAKFALSTLPQENGIKVVITESDLSQPNSPLSSDEVRKQLLKKVGDEMSNISRNLGAAKNDKNGDNRFLADVNGYSMLMILSWVAQPSTEVFASWIRDSNQNTLPDSTTFFRIWATRVEMAHSVEGRTPFLDHHLTDYVNRLPPSVKVAYSTQQTAADTQQDDTVWKNAGSALQSITEKWILRKAVRPYITDEVYRRGRNPFRAPVRWPKEGRLHRMFEKLLLVMLLKT